MRVRRGAMVGAVALSVVGMVVAYRLGRARADGVPMVNPLYYGGMLDDGGRPVEGTRNVTVRLWDAATAGATVCTTNAGATAFSGGRFRVALDGACVGAVRANPELWAELQVEGTTFPRSKLGAVPYALEAGRATGAAGALEARLAAAEGRSTGGRQVVIGSWRPTAPGSAGDAFPVTCSAPDSAVAATVPLVGAPFSITFTAAATAIYRIALPSSVIQATGACCGRTNLNVSPMVPLQFLGAGGYWLQLTAGEVYSLTMSVQLPDCSRSWTANVTTPFIIEQIN